MPKLSVTIITFNEESNIKECLESVKWADEIILVDSESRDKTIEIAKAYTDKVITKKWEGFSVQKSFALANAGNEWVLSIDADERVTPELKEEIQSLLSAEPSPDGYFIPRRNFFLGREIKNCGWYPDYQMRLFRKSKTVVDPRKVHEGFLVNGNTGHLKNAFIHFTHNNLHDTFKKINEYSTLEAEELYLQKKAKPINIFLNPAAAFLNHFFHRGGYKDGVYGLMVSLIHAVTKMMMYMKMWDLQNKRKDERK
jgi:glycosyltransferase involved in cell wall biosynthesis